MNSKNVNSYFISFIQNLMHGGGGLIESPEQSKISSTHVTTHMKILLLINGKSFKDTKNNPQLLCCGYKSTKKGNRRENLFWLFLFSILFSYHKFKIHVCLV